MGNIRRNESANIRMRIVAVALGIFLATIAAVSHASVQYVFTYAEYCLLCKADLILTTDQGQQGITAFTRGHIAAVGGVIDSWQNGPYSAVICSAPECPTFIESRTWFAFTMRSASYSVISQATLRITVPNPTPPLKSISLVSGFGTYTLHGLTSGTENSFPSELGGCCSNFEQLGQGPVFGSITMRESDEGTVVSIPLNDAGIAYLQSIFDSYDPINDFLSVAVLGGALTIPDAPPLPVPSLSLNLALTLAGMMLAVGLWCVYFRRNKPTP